MLYELVMTRDQISLLHWVHSMFLLFKSPTPCFFLEIFRMDHCCIVYQESPTRPDGMLTPKSGCLPNARLPRLVLSILFCRKALHTFKHDLNSLARCVISHTAQPRLCLKAWQILGWTREHRAVLQMC